MPRGASTGKGETGRQEGDQGGQAVETGLARQGQDRGKGGPFEGKGRQASRLAREAGPREEARREEARSGEARSRSHEESRFGEAGRSPEASGGACASQGG